MRAQHGGHERRGKDALGLAGRLSERSPSRDFYVSYLSASPSLSLSLSASQQQDGQLGRGVEMETDDRKREIESCHKLGKMGKINF